MKEKQKNDNVLPNFYLPNWLMPDVEQVISVEYKIAQQLQKQATSKQASEVDFHGAQAKLRHIKQIFPAFTDKSLRDVWEKLYNISPENTVKFARQLLKIQNQFEYVVKKHERIQCAIEWRREITKTMRVLIKQIDNNKRSYGFRFSLCSNSFYNELVAIEKETSAVADTLKKDCKKIADLSSALAPISRKYNSTTAMPTYFARVIFFLFKKLYNKPMHSEIAKFINTIFPEAIYNDNSIIKMMENSHDDSLESKSLTADGLLKTLSASEQLKLIFKCELERIGGGSGMFFNMN